LTDPSSAVKTGKLLGAKALITGRIIASGDSVILVAKVISTETSRVFGEMVTVPTDGSFEKPITELAGKVEKLLADQAVAFNPPVESKEEKIARLKSLVANKKLPSVQIHIEERDLSLRPIDPAMQTEFELILSTLGFEVISFKNPAKAPDVSISGEAFSQTGARHGQLVSARARAEVQAIRRSDNKVLDTDRETATAIDTAEAIAGKSALQDAAFKLIERMVPKLVNQ
ncbi:MAG: curli assembly protein CsgG, partial [Chthoniobacterales bacterium]